MFLNYRLLNMGHLAVTTFMLVSLCSLPLYAGNIKSTCSSSMQKINDARYDAGKYEKRWPGQGDPKVEKVRKCIRHRESRGNYKVVDKGHRWFGAYQFDPITSNTAAKMMKRPDLVGVFANKWTRKEQDAAFYLVYNRGKGKKHFYHPEKKCF